MLPIHAATAADTEDEDSDSCSGSCSGSSSGSGKDVSYSNSSGDDDGAAVMMAIVSRACDPMILSSWSTPPTKP